MSAGETCAPFAGGLQSEFGFAIIYYHNDGVKFVDVSLRLVGTSFAVLVRQSRRAWRMRATGA